jgi:hypothetical protein
MEYNRIILENPDQLKIDIVAGGIYTGNSLCKPYSTIQSETKYLEMQGKNHPKYANARKSVVKIVHRNDSVFIIIKSFTDPVKTKLSKLGVSDLNELGEYYHPTQGYNPYLSALRTCNIYNYLCKYLLSIYMPDAYITLNNKKLYLSDLEKLFYQ